MHSAWNSQVLLLNWGTFSSSINNRNPNSTICDVSFTDGNVHRGQFSQHLCVKRRITEQRRVHIFYKYFKVFQLTCRLAIEFIFSPGPSLRLFTVRSISCHVNHRQAGHVLDKKEKRVTSFYFGFKRVPQYHQLYAVNRRSSPSINYPVRRYGAKCLVIINLHTLTG